MRRREWEREKRYVVVAKEDRTSAYTKLRTTKLIFEVILRQTKYIFLLFSVYHVGYSVSWTKTHAKKFIYFYFGAFCSIIVTVQKLWHANLYNNNITIQIFFCKERWKENYARNFRSKSPPAHKVITLFIHLYLFKLFILMKFYLDLDKNMYMV